MTITLPPVGRPADLAIYATRIDRAATTATHALAWIDELRANVITLAAARYDTGGGHGSSVPDPTATCTAELDHIDRMRIDILDAIATLGVAVNVVEAAIRTVGRSRARQTGTDPDGTHLDGRTCIGHAGLDPGTTCHETPTYRFDPTGAMILGERCIRCEAAHEAHQRRKAADAARKRAERHGLKETA